METTTQQDLFVKMAVTAWKTQNERVDKLLETLSNNVLMMETAPSRNRGIYLLGHLVAVNDRLFTLFGLGDRLHPELDTIFLTNPDRSTDTIPSVDELKQYWKNVNEKLDTAFRSMSSANWFSRHNSVTPEDFEKDPQRNKLNVLLNRTSHTAYHLGQLIYLKPKS
jgi:hypothetical protein